MDKKDFKYFIMIILKINFWGVIVLGIPFTILTSVLTGISEGKVLEILKNNIITMIYSIISLLIFICLCFGMCYALVSINKKKDILKTNIYVRELPDYFPPAIASLLLDLSIDTTTDYTATIAYLISKKHIELSNDEQKVKLLLPKELLKTEHELYVLQCITKEKEFNHEQLRKFIISDAKNMKLVKEGKRKTHFFRNVGISLALYYFFINFGKSIEVKLIKNIFNYLAVISEVLFFGVLAYTVYIIRKNNFENVFRTKLGRQEARRWVSVKKFLKDYTLISEKKIQDIKLFDDYIPYAIALKEAKNIEKEIQHNEEYRILIYGRDTIFDIKQDK